MAAPPSSRLQSMLQAAVQSVQWTYSLFWQFCPQQGILVWSEGYYNGAIKTRKTVQPMEVSAEETSLQRSQQLRELYDSLSAGETNQPARRPCAALSPEDLTESEWFYLMCVSFSFAPAVGLPGKAYAKRQHIWLCGANEVSSETFSRAILAKSARIQTVVCIPILDGVVELGSTEKVEEDSGLVQHIKSFFSDSHQHKPPAPALSEHSTSNPAAIYAAVDLAMNPEDNNIEATDEDDEEEEEEEEEEPLFDSAETRRTSQERQAAAVSASELMQLQMSEDIRLGSPEDASNNLDSDFHALTVSQSGVAEQQRLVESSRRCIVSLQEPLGSSNLQQLHPGTPSLEELSEEATHYSQTVSTILQNQETQARWADSYSMAYSKQTAFAAWTNRVGVDHLLPGTPADATSQWLLKYILFTVPFLHNKYRDEHSPKSRDGDGRFRKGSAAQDELSANHVLAERRRREKLNERFIILRSLVPFVTKMDKASILGDTIEYVKELRKKIQDLEAKNKQMEAERRSSSKSGLSSCSGERGRSAAPEKRKMRIVEGTGGGAKPRTVVETTVEVSIIESDALLEMQCAHREGLLLDVMQLLRDLRIETTAVQSSLSNGVFVAEVRAKVKENVNGKKTSIMEVKRAIKQIIP